MNINNLRIGDVVTGWSRHQAQQLTGKVTCITAYDPIQTVELGWGNWIEGKTVALVHTSPAEIIEKINQLSDLANRLNRRP